MGLHLSKLGSPRDLRGRYVCMHKQMNIHICIYIYISEYAYIFFSGLRRDDEVSV